uniref:Uncharacterized protein n=2 Tax=Aplanochytrium stocchinoi TaxID=215587 RepID=A0A7S3LKX7_9STRA
MVDLYENRGLPREKAQVVVKTMAKYRDFFIDVMMCEELKLQVPDEDDNPAKEGFVTFVSFLIFGFLPLIGYAISPLLFNGMSETTLFVVACGITMTVLFILGAFKSKFSTKSWVRSGLEFLLLGSAAATTSYFTGLVVKSLGEEWFAAHPQ